MDATEGSAAGPSDRRGDGATAGHTTRGFLFADLRGYTDYVEGHGAAAAADLLERYRELVRTEIERSAGAEIRTEGDSFYVVYESVSGAVRGGLSIVEAAAGASAGRPDAPIRVGIGIHAGETVETADGYVGSPVNIAARICALAAPGEVLVSDTVRALTQSVLPLRFEARGRRQLKGVGEAVALFAVTPTGEGVTAWMRQPAPGRLSSRRGRILAGAAVATLGVGVVAVIGFLAFRPIPGLPPGPWRIAIQAPPVDDEPLGSSIDRGVSMAVEEVNAAGGIGGVVFEIRRFTDGPFEGLSDEQILEQARSNAAAQAADPTIVAVVGPVLSPIAKEQLPIANEAGLLQCSPTATDPVLTDPLYGALKYRPAAPERINFVRVVSANDVEGLAMASFAFHDLAIDHVLVVDDTGALGRQVADLFSAAYEELSGRTTRRAVNPGEDPSSAIEPLSTGSDAPKAVYFGGGFGAAELRAAMVEAGHSSLPFLSWEGIRVPEYLQAAGAAAEGTYVTQTAVPPARNDFVGRYRTAFGEAPDSIASAAYACTEIILGALRHASETSPSASGLREAVRATAVDPATGHETVLGPVGFDANGDAIDQYVTFYRADLVAQEWVVDDQQRFTTSP